LPAVLDMLNSAPAMITSLAPIQVALGLYHQFIPFASMGLGWLVPTLIGFALSLIWSHLRLAGQRGTLPERERF